MHVTLCKINVNSATLRAESSIQINATTSSSFVEGARHKLHLMHCSDDVQGVNSINIYQNIVATWRTATVICVCPAIAHGIQVKQKVFEVCNSMWCA